MERDRPEPTWQELVMASDAGRSAPERAADLCDAHIAGERLKEIDEHPERLVRGEELKRRLDEMDGERAD